jgi:DNA-binding LacI/PurR family transcriptional regulator
MATRVVELLQSRLIQNFGGEPRRITLPGEIILRQSTAPFEATSGK